MVIEEAPARAGAKNSENWKVVQRACSYFLLWKLFLWEKNSSQLSGAWQVAQRSRHDALL